jgi:hypothetical protein
MTLTELLKAIAPYYIPLQAAWSVFWSFAPTPKPNSWYGAIFHLAQWIALNPGRSIAVTAQNSNGGGSTPPAVPTQNTGVGIKRPISRSSLKGIVALIPGLLGWLLAWAVLLSAFVGRMAGQNPQDILITGGTNPYIIIGRGIAWGGSGFGNTNNNYIFHPVTPDEGFCLFLSNNNPSNSHTITVAVSQTGDPAVNSFIGLQQKWNSVPTTSAFPVTVPILGIVGINYKTTASAGIAVQLSGSTVQAGSPDTVDIFAVQTTASSCGALSSNAVQGPYQQGAALTLSQQFPVLVGGLYAPGSTTSAQGLHIGNDGNGLLADGALCCQSWASGFANPSGGNFGNFQVAQSLSQQREGVVDSFSLGFIGAHGVKAGYVATNFLEAVMDQFALGAGSQPGFQILGRVVNPGTSGTILHQFMQNTGGAANGGYKFLTLSCSAACELAINRTSAVGTTCTALTVRNLQIGNNGTVEAAAGNDLAENACATQPAVTYQMYDIFLAAGTSQILDLTGLVNFHNSTQGGGIDVVNVTSLTGTVAATLTYAEE